jgi:hypothetical protein
MPRFIPTLPQWSCADCGTRMTRHRAYGVAACAVVPKGPRVVGIQRTVDGAYCKACAVKAAQAAEGEPDPHTAGKG